MNFTYWKQSLDNSSLDTILNYDYKEKCFINVDENTQRQNIIYKMTEDFHVVKEVSKYVIKKNQRNILIKFQLNEQDSFKRNSTSVFMIEEYENKNFKHIFDNFLKTDDFLAKTPLTIDEIPDLINSLAETENKKIKKKILISITSLLILILLTYLVFN